MTDLHPFIAGLPKAELHVHHVGSASPRIVAELAARHPDSKVPTDPEALADYFTFTDFAHFIDVYLSVVDLIRTPEDVRLLTFEVARDMARQNIRYAELTITPYSSTRRGIDERAFMEAIEDARKAAEAEFGTVLRWCFDIPGEAGLAAAEETARLATDDGLRPEGLVSFGLGGPEIGVPRPQFKPYFDRAIAAGLHSVPHAGETTGPQTIWDALDRPARRAHRPRHQLRPGPEAPRPPRRAPHRAGGLPDLQHRHPRRRAPWTSTRSRRWWRPGVLVTINSDDPPMFGTDLNNEYAVAARLLGLDERGARRPREERRGGLVPRRGRQGPDRRRDRHVHRRLARPLTAAPARGHPGTTSRPMQPPSPPWPIAATRTASARTRSTRSRSAIERGADAVEIDVRLTRDGVPVLLHDDTLKRLWGHDRPPRRALRRARCGELTDGGVPTLREALLTAGDAPADAGPAGRRRGLGPQIVGRRPRVRRRGARVLLRRGAAMLAGPRRRPVRRDRPDLDLARPAPAGTARRGAPPLAQLPLRPGESGSDRPGPPGRAARLGLDRGHPPHHAQADQHGVDSITTNRVDALAAVLRKARP